MKEGRNEMCSYSRRKNYKDCCTNNEQKASFILTKDVYERDFLPLFILEECRPKTFIEFEVILPLHIPMYISNIVTISSEQGYFGFRFDMIIHIFT